MSANGATKKDLQRVVWRLQINEARLRDALQPFAVLANLIEKLNFDDAAFLRDAMPRTWPTVKHIREARAALAQTGES